MIGRPILELLGAAAGTAFEAVTDGKALILTPVEDASRHTRFRKSMEKTGTRYAKSCEGLAK